MAWHKSSHQGYRDWLTNDAYCADNTKRSSLAPSSGSQRPFRLSDLYKASPIISSGTVKHIQDKTTEDSMSATESTLHWPTLHSLAQYGPQTYHSSPSSLEQYPVSLGAMDVDYGVNTTDSAAYVYDVPPNFASVNAASSCPRIYSNELNLTYFTTPEAEAEAYPPTSYLMDPQKHELYMDPTRQQTLNHCSFVGSQPETVSSLSTLSIEPDGDPDSHMSPHPDQTSSSTSSEKLECRKKPTTDDKDEAPSRPSKVKEEMESEENEPYAQLIYRALKDAPENKMVLKDIYQWFMAHTDKSKNPSRKGWQNSIRHNLSMNGAFKKVEQDPASGDSKKGFVWVLEPSAIKEGVKSTTRYRKAGPSKKGGRSDSLALQRQASGRKGGQASRRAKCGKSKRVEKGVSPAVVARLASVVEEADDLASKYYGNEAISEQGDQDSELVARHLGRPVRSADLSEDPSCYPYYMPLTTPLSKPLKLEENPYTINDIIGVGDHFPGEALFYDGSDLTVDPMMAGLSLHDASPNF